MLSIRMKDVKNHTFTLPQTLPLKKVDKRDKLKHNKLMLPRFPPLHPPAHDSETNRT